MWNISYQRVSCASNWSGSKYAAALGSVPSLEDGACCPADPTVTHHLTCICSSLIFLTRPQGSANDTCPSFSDQNGEPYVYALILVHVDPLIFKLSPDTASSGGAANPRLHILVVLTWIAALLTPLMHFSLW